LQVADLVLPVFAVVLTGWIVGATGYLARSLSDALIHFDYNIAMPALLIVTIAQEPAYSLIDWRFLIAFGGGSLLCFALVFGMVRLQGRHDLASQTMYGMAAAMTNTGFVALPVLQAIYGERGGADRQDGLYPRRRISLRRDHGRRHRICHHAAVHRVASGLAVRVVRMGAMTMAGPASGWPR
jgi:hypothetical protein